MSAIIVNYELTMKDAADPSTSSASANLNGDRYSAIMPVQRSFMGSIVAVNVAGPVGNWILEGSNDFGLPDDESYDRVNSENLITNWATIEERSVGSSDVDNLFQLSDIGYRWVRVFYDSTSGTANVNSARANFKGY